MSDDYKYNHSFESYVQKQVQEAREESKKITKVVIATIEDDSDVGELMKGFATFYVVSTEETAQEMKQFHSVIDLGKFIDAEQRKGIIKDVHEPKHYDYLLDFSDREDEAAFALFGVDTITTKDLEKLNINLSKFDTFMYGRQCPIVNGKVVYYKSDVIEYLRKKDAIANRALY